LMPDPVGLRNCVQSFAVAPTGNGAALAAVGEVGSAGSAESTERAIGAVQAASNESVSAKVARKTRGMAAPRRVGGFRLGNLSVPRRDLQKQSPLWINADLAPNCQHGARGFHAIHACPLRTVKQGPIHIERELAHRIHIPFRM